LTIAKGDSVALIGQSGSGKSTLLNIIGGLDKPDGGGVEVCGRDYSKISERELAWVRNREIGFVFQGGIAAILIGTNGPPRRLP
jgi:putative ABC transport system ATP-binding protein